MARKLRETLLNNAHVLIDAAYNEDRLNRNRLERLLSGEPDPEFKKALKTRGMPIYLQEHDSGWKDVQVGEEYVDAVSCRLVELKYIPELSQEFTPIHQWPVGDEMIIYMPVKKPLTPNGDKSEYPIEPDASTDDIFIRYIVKEIGEDGVELSRTSILYALGKEYCYAYTEIADADSEIELMMQNLKDYVQTLHLKQLAFKYLTDFSVAMAAMTPWPINTYWPGVTANELNPEQ